MDGWIYRINTSATLMNLVNLAALSLTLAGSTIKLAIHNDTELDLAIMDRILGDLCWVSFLDQACPRNSVGYVSLFFKGVVGSNIISISLLLVREIDE